MSKRYLEIDFVRGLAVLGMVVFHFAYDLNFLRILELDVWRGGWLLLARVVQFIFIFTAGLTLWIAYDRASRHGWKTATLFRLRHAAHLAGWALLITAITTFLFPGQAVVFGVLHFYATAMVLSLPFMKLRGWNSLFGLVIFLITPWMDTFSFSSSWGIPLGLTPSGFQSLDYFPLFPWFGLFLQGVAAGSWLHSYSGLRYSFPSVFSSLIPRFFVVIGKNSLWIYLLHQPILVGAILLVRSIFY